MAAAVAVLASLAFIGWLIYRAMKGEPFKDYVVTYAVAVVTGAFILAFSLSMDIPQLIKIVASILLGITLIIMAAYRRRHQQGRP